MERSGRMDGFPNNPKQRLLKKKPTLNLKEKKKYQIANICIVCIGCNIVYQIEST